jgi:uncharacterized protein (TIGR03000 family)
MFRRRQLLTVASATVLLVAVTAGDAAAQYRRGFPIRPNPVVRPYRPPIGLPNPLSNPWFRYWYMRNKYGYPLPYYGMPYAVPTAVPVAGGYQPGANPGVNDIVVQLPIASAKVWINGVETAGTGQSTRHFTVSDITAGNQHEFKIKAEWTIDGKTRSDVRTVYLDGSRHQVVNFLVPEGQ